jgi:hypothetical protein
VCVCVCVCVCEVYVQLPGLSRSGTQLACCRDCGWGDSSTPALPFIFTRVAGCQGSCCLLLPTSRRVASAPVGSAPTPCARWKVGCSQRPCTALLLASNDTQVGVGAAGAVHCICVGWTAAAAAGTSSAISRAHFLLCVCAAGCAGSSQCLRHHSRQSAPLAPCAGLSPFRDPLDFGLRAAGGSFYTGEPVGGRHRPVLQAALQVWCLQPSR